MAKRMRYDNEKFAKDFAANFTRLGVDTQEEAGAKLGVSQNAIHSWLSGSSFPQKDRWKTIKENLGIYPGDYRVTVQAMSGGQVVSNVNAATKGQVHISYSGGKESHPEEGIDAKLSPDEYETFTLFREFGNKFMLQKCLDGLRAEKQRMLDKYAE